jgi:hypothetical protein
MPYVDWGAVSMYDLRKKCFENLIKDDPEPPADGDEWNELPIGAKLLNAYFWAKSPIHDRRTLDQSYYNSLPLTNIRKRDLDQVLYRYMEKENVAEEDRRILMVDQLWLWILDTPITKIDGSIHAMSKLHNNSITQIEEVIQETATADCKCNRNCRHRISSPLEQSHLSQ